MCTMISNQIEIDGAGKGANGWFTLKRASVSYDHPFRALTDHALNIDFVNDELGLAARVAVELTPESARILAEGIISILAEVEGYANQ